MGTRTSSRKRGEECLSVNQTSSYLNSSEFRVPKKPRFSFLNRSTGRSVLSSNSTVSRISRYPELKPRLPREVHAPCPLKFDLLSRDSRRKNSPVFDKESVEKMGNILSLKYEKAKKSALAAVRYPNKGKEVIEVDTDSQKNEVSEDSSIEEVEIIEDGREGRSVVTDQWWQETDATVVGMQDLDPKVQDGGIQLQSTSSVVSELTNGGYLKEDIAEKMLDFLSLGMEDDVFSISAYRKLLESVEKRTRTLKRLDFEINLNEERRTTLALLRPKKEPEPIQVQDIPREPFIPLTKEDEAGVAKAFSVNRRKVLVAHENSNIEITGELLQCLRPGAWLNDEVINLYLELLKEREKREPLKFLKCHFFNTFFYKKLVSGRNGYDFKSVRRWTSQRKLGYSLIECDKIFVPIHKEIHWCLAIINKKDEKLQYLDSLKGTDTKVLRVLARYIADEVKDKSGQDIDVSSWEQEFVEDLPEQENGYDCGMFMIKYADFYSRGLGLCFNQEHMPYFRLRTAKEILRLRAD